eukprot:1160307-Pyramimonas_sp.AAC.1
MCSSSTASETRHVKCNNDMKATCCTTYHVVFRKLKHFTAGWAKWKKYIVVLTVDVGTREARGTRGTREAHARTFQKCLQFLIGCIRHRPNLVAINGKPALLYIHVGAVSERCRTTVHVYRVLYGLFVALGALIRSDLAPVLGFASDSRTLPRENKYVTQRDGPNVTTRRADRKTDAIEIGMPEHRDRPPRRAA